jgi:hypothetical protein
VSFREGWTGRGRVVWAGKDRPRAMSEEIQSAPGAMTGINTRGQAKPGFDA